jgi:DNA-binding response OmpR family regulator
MLFEKRVLLVEDDESLLGMLQTVLSNSGYHVKGACTGTEALRLLEEFHPELVLMDIGLPDISGLEILRQVRSHPATKDVIVILLTGSAGLEMKIEGFSTGAHDYLSKPVNPRELLLRIERFFTTVAVQRETLARQQKEDLHTVVNTLAHELNTPLGAIHNDVCLCLLDLPLEEIKKRLLSIEGNVKRIEDILVKLRSAVRFVSKEPIPGIHLLDLEQSSRI